MGRRRQFDFCVRTYSVVKGYIKNSASCSCSVAINVSIDLTLSVTDIIRLYGYLIKIECICRDMKQVIDAFGYRIWSKSMPKLNRYLKEGAVHQLENVKNGQVNHRIRWLLKR